jgi:hypothetical protein
MLTDAWIYDFASSSARLTLLDACLSGIPSSYMAMFLLNKTLVELLNKNRRRFMWEGNKNKNLTYY